MAVELHRLCLRCQSIDFDLHEPSECESLRCDYAAYFQQHTKEDIIQPHSTISYHCTTLLNLKESAKRNCHLCILLWTAVTNPEAEDYPEVDLQSTSISVFVCRDKLQLFVNDRKRPIVLGIEDIPTRPRCRCAADPNQCQYESVMEGISYVVQSEFVEWNDQPADKQEPQLLHTIDYSHFIAQGYRGLEYTRSELFDVFREEGDHFLARKHCSLNGRIGWIPKKHHTILYKPPHPHCVCGKGVWEPTLLKSNVTAYVDTNPISDTMLSQISQWMSFCESQRTHEHCIPPNPHLPLRVIDVGSLNVAQPPFLSIGEGRRGIYVTLSYRWGLGKHYRLTSSSLDKMTQKISLKELPKTLVDAMTITRLLGIKFIWIDALCIIQDSEEDWATQSRIMCQIYSNAWLNISADRAKAADQGFIEKRNILETRSCAIPTFGHRGFTHSGSVVLPHSGSPLGLYYQGPFFRGWIFQERLFSRRILHFNHSMTTWECHGGSANENMPLIRQTGGPAAHHQKTHLHRDMPIGTLFASNDDEMIYWILRDWYKDLNLFTCTRFTYATDKLSAIAGLAMTYAKWLGAEKCYFAGLWVIDFPRALLWRNATQDRAGTSSFGLPTVLQEESKLRGSIFALGELDAGRRKSNESGYIAPSFSWASVNFPIYHPWAAIPGVVFSSVRGASVKCKTGAHQKSPSLLAIYVQHQHYEFGPILDCWIRVRGMTILYSELLGLPHFIGRKSDASHLVLDNGHHNPDPAKLPSSLTLLLLQLTLGGSTPNASQWIAIILVPASTSKDEFRRVGYYTVAEDSNGMSLDSIDYGLHRHNPARSEVYTDEYFSGWDLKEIKIV